ncbi:MAG TPA: zf-HC2 domain-containing protein [Oscillatoriaceae cyanobacterium]
MTVPCEDWLEDISSYLDGELPVEAEQRVHGHLRQCTSCAEYMVELVPLVKTLRHLPAPVPSTDPWRAIAAELRREPRFARRAWWRDTNRIGWAAAAVVISVSSAVAIGVHQRTSVPVADVNMYLHQHEIYARQDGVPSLYAPEFTALKASYHLDK